ncbi:MAG: GNAT family N-acetyltransferase [Lachnospiraceae bacterium]|nr:GNAT family N-acetyltransferase [Lachnospiraceae bacterium]
MEYIKEKRALQVGYGQEADLASWMKLVNRVSWNFPGLETAEAIKEHADTVLRFMKKQQAICVKDDDKVVGVLLFSRTHNMICCLAVSPDYRRKRIGASMLNEALSQLDRTKDISVSTFREEDPKGTAPRALYRKFGFVEDELIEEFGYPNQRFILFGSELG